MARIGWLSLSLTLGIMALPAGAGVKINPGNMSPYSHTHVGAKLYTPPDDSATGGIQGTILKPPTAVLGVLAMPQRYANVSGTGSAAKNQEDTKVQQSNPVYLAKLDEKNHFEFNGLPPGKYDLLVMCDDRLYEGLQLLREPTTLTPADIESIKEKQKVSNPFYDTKTILRSEGTTGGFGSARVLEEQLRARPVTLQDARVLDNIQIRAIKLCLYECVAAANGKKPPMWELKRTREITRQEVGPPDVKGLIPNKFCLKLRSIRVVNRVKDLGAFELTDDPVPVVKPISDSELEPTQN